MKSVNYKTNVIYLNGHKFPSDEEEDSTPEDSWFFEQLSLVGEMDDGKDPDKYTEEYDDDRETPGFEN